MAHVNTLDMGVTFFITLGIFSLLLAQNEQAIPFRRNWMMLAWAAMALAVLSKGLMGLILPGAALFLYSLFNRDVAVWLRMHWISGPRFLRGRRAVVRAGDAGQSRVLSVLLHP
jgi:4-amino-4-deoxy-L-arabinose transferase-like glycosyltransferase